MIKQTLISITLLLSLNLFGQNNLKQIKLSRKNFISAVKIINADSADKALVVASFLFNSKEFQDSMQKLNFPFANNCVDCGSNSDENKPHITGQTILENIFKVKQVYLTLRLKKVGKPPAFGKCFGLGNTCPNTDSITSFYKNINCDMAKDLPFSYAYAVHLCHEFIHNVGYCHTDNNIDNDIAEAVGWIAFHFIKEWYDEGKIIK